MSLKCNGNKWGQSRGSPCSRFIVLCCLMFTVLKTTVSHLLSFCVKFFSGEKVNSVPITSSWPESEIFKAESLVNSMEKLKYSHYQRLCYSLLFWDLGLLKNSNGRLISKHLYSKCRIYWVRKTFCKQHLVIVFYVEKYNYSLWYFSHPSWPWSSETAFLIVCSINDVKKDRM